MSPSCDRRAATCRPLPGPCPCSWPRSRSPGLGDARMQKFRVGVVVTAEGGSCRDLYATLPVPADWPEQKVQIMHEDVSPDVRSLRYRTLPGGVKQMVVEIPELRAGDKARAIVTFALERASITAPAHTDALAIPEKPDRALRQFLGASPYIETRHPKIMKLAKTTGADLDGWRKAEAIYDVVREKVEYRNGDLKGAARALADGWGDCEELTCLFIAMARAEGIPARTVWVEGHCYPEFYLVDADGQGWWYPCQAAGTRAFGSMPDQLPILQKGDAFRDPDRPGKTLRYVSEFIRGSARDGGGSPKVVWIREGA
ncbi:MAG: transglutaminase domain-containing protein [Planctomycetia bacterium]|nr:transglutaminase domain-containing protein [Planctomycetia bacterium]